MKLATLKHIYEIVWDFLQIYFSDLHLYISIILPSSRIRILKRYDLEFEIEIRTPQGRRKHLKLGGGHDTSRALFY